MELIPKKIADKIPKLYETENTDPIVYVKLFTPDSNWSWFVTEFSIDGDTAFGYVASPFGAELGYFSLEEINGIRGNLDLGVERDLEFKPTKLSSIKKASLY